ncbi:MAG TPA: prolyl oligopeptidase family serine peptidase, partial [Vicinamibacterales bacterium]|nr:prolyl oligopeptidase family serine peptidase [Vicinamibacterales bacterium]
QRAADERASTWEVGRDGSGLRQLSADEAGKLDTPPPGLPDRAGLRTLAAENGDIVIYDVGTGARRVVIRTATAESNPRWARNDTAITFTREGNLYLLSLAETQGPPLVQLTDIVPPPDAAPGAAAGRGAAAATGQRGGGGGGRGGGGRGAGAAGGGAGGELTEAQRWLREQERELIEFIRKQAEQRESGRGGGRGGRGGGAGDARPSDPIPQFRLQARQSVADLQLSADERFVWIGISERAEAAARGQDTPNYVTESAYPEMISGRPNVGDVQPRRLLAVLDLKENKSVWADATTFAGTERKAATNDPSTPRLVDWGVPDMSPDGAYTIVPLTAQDNKDRWLTKVDPTTGKATVVEQLHDDAWVRSMGIGGGGGGFGGGAGIAWLPDNKTFLFLSEKDGWMHLYSLDASAPTPQARQLTSGTWEVTRAELSRDRSKVFLTTTEVHPGERHFYSMPVGGGARTKITTLTGSNTVTVSPDEGALAIVYSYSTKPDELYVMPMMTGAAAKQVTTTPSDEWRNFKWIDPKVVTYKARDGVDVYARLFTPEMIGARRDPRRPAVVFVHGAGYLQNAHKYWSTYYREFMFHNLLASRGYVVLDPDYRASSGYGRDWRTAIYRHMGGHDLNDVVDGAKFLVQTEKVDAKRIGVYGGSYGGFITLMAMFTSPDTFAAGAALRPVTDWAHYNHGYTSNILNVPTVDAESFKKSSPIYFADGLKGQLLILHGMVDTNVFFQDSVRLVQRLIELRKENWSIAPYPVENHGFTEETSWADEYKRILRLFEDTLRNR